MANWTTYVAQAGFWLGAAWVLGKVLRRDVTGVARKVRENERKRVRGVAVLLELHAEEPDHVRRLARWLYDDTWDR